MSRARPTTLALAALASAALALSSATTADAGTYYVRACHADGVNAAWVPSGTTDLVAYAECPAIGNNLGLVVRNVDSATPATGFANARWTATAPPGTYIDELRWTGQLFRTSAWGAGIYDRGNGRWLWCGASCGTLPTWHPFQIGGFATNAIESMAICAATQCARSGRQGGVAMKDITLRLQDVTVPNVAIVGGSLATPGWKSGVQTVEVDSNDNTGIARIRASIDGTPGTEEFSSCDDHRLVPCPRGLRRPLDVDLRPFPDGRHTLAVHAFDGSGNTWNSPQPISVDNTAPDAPQGLTAHPASWHSEGTFRLSWTNPPQAAAPIAGARYQICREKPGPTDPCRAPATVGRPNITALDALRPPAPGSWRVRVWLSDAAGNQNAQTFREVFVRWDPELPTLQLLPRSVDDPTRIVGRASDAVSGIARAEVEMQRQSDPMWHSLAVTRTRDGFTAVVDDQRFPRGTYAIRARVTDQAGNEKSVTASAITLPVRLVTSLAVGQLKRPKADRAGSRRGRPILVRRPEMRFGRTMQLSGRLTSPGGNPLTGRDVEVSEKLSVPGSAWNPMATVRSNSSGRFTFKARSGPTRLLRFRYAGTPTIRGRTTVVLLRVRAASSIRASRRRVVNGESVTFRGIVRSQPIPTTGKLLQLQVFSRGSWLTFATPRADARGRWHHPYRFTATRGLTRYRFRVRLPRESGYPYEAGVSKPAKVTVRGV